MKFSENLVSVSVNKFYSMLVPKKPLNLWMILVSDSFNLPAISIFIQCMCALRSHFICTKIFKTKIMGKIGCSYEDFTRGSQKFLISMDDVYVRT